MGAPPEIPRPKSSTRSTALVRRASAPPVDNRPLMRDSELSQDRVGTLPGRRPVMDARSRSRRNEAPPVGRRTFLQTLAGGAAALAAGRSSGAVADDLDAVRREIEKRHDEAVKRLQAWIRQPSIAAENRGMAEGCDHMMRLLREAGFERVAKISTDGHPGVFATLDAGAPKTLGLYYMYDV